MPHGKKFINISLALDGVHPSFKKLLLSKEIKPQFINAMTSIDPDDISPNPKDIFHFAKYGGLDDINVVIIGQDPNPVDDNGLCFSSPTVSGTLRNIYSCLEESKLIDSAKEMKTSDLRSWAQQGVLMMNMALTTRKNKAAQHMALWEPITRNIIKTLGTAARPIVFMFWGDYAKSMKTLITSKHAHVLLAEHPSPTNQVRLPENQKFTHCKHFMMANDALEASGHKPICWDPSHIEDHMVFTDGSGLNTGDCNSKGSYATLFVRGASKGSMMFGRIPPVALIDLDDLKGDDNWNPEVNPCWIGDNRAYTINGKHSKTKTWSNPLAIAYIKDVDHDMVFPTSQRGEGMAILVAFEHVIHIGKTCRIEVVTDSMFWINMVTKYMPKWVKQGRPFSVQKNPDIVSRMWKSMEMMEEVGIQYSLRHIKSHGKDPNADPFDVAMNEIVDVKALETRDIDVFGDFTCTIILE